MLAQHYAVMARYNRWMNERLDTLAAQLSDAERKQERGAFFHSIHGTLNHLLLADRIWLGRFTRDPELARSIGEDGAPIVVRSLDQELYSSFEQLKAERLRTDTQLESWVAGLNDIELEHALEYNTSRGDTCSHPLWWALTHFFNHQTHHRGQITTLFNQIGMDVGATDLIAMLRS